MTYSLFPFMRVLLLLLLLEAAEVCETRLLSGAVSVGVLCSSGLFVLSLAGVSGAGRRERATRPPLLLPCLPLSLPLRLPLRSKLERVIALSDCRLAVTTKRPEFKPRVN